MNPKIVTTVKDLNLQLDAIPQARWVVLGKELFRGAHLQEIERVYPDRSLNEFCLNIRDDTKRAIKQLFSEVSKQDNNRLFPLTAGVPLSIDGWNDIEIVLSAMLYLKSQSDLIILTPSNGAKMRMATLLIGQSPIYFFPILLATRFFRTLLRVLLAPRLPKSSGNSIWISVGSFLQLGHLDTYYARWPWLSQRPFLRIYMRSGGSVNLKGDEQQQPLEYLVKWADLWTALQSVWFALIQIRTWGTDNITQRLIKLLCFEQINNGEVFTLALQRQAWKNMVEELKPTFIVTPYEGRAWEIELFKIANERGIRTVGYQHSSLTPRHLALLDNDREMNLSYIPDVIITCGEVTARRLIEARPILKNRIHVGIALRSANVPARKLGDAILVALSSSRHEAFAIFHLFSEAHRLGMSGRVIFRAHPTIPVNDLFALFEWPETITLSSEHSLDKDLVDSWCVAYSSATVVLEGMRMGRIPIYIDIGEVLSGDPLVGVTWKLIANNPKTLKEIAESYNQNPKIFLEIQGQATKYAEQYLIAPSNDRLAEMSSLLNKP